MPEIEPIDPAVFGPLAEQLEPLWAAFVAGFNCSGEGFNAEWPTLKYAERYDAMRRGLRRSFEEWIAENVLVAP